MADRIRKINVSTRDSAHVVIQSGLGSSTLRSIDVSTGGTIYGADTGRHIVFKIFPDGRALGVLVGTTSSSGHVNSTGIETDGNDARLASPVGLCVDASENIYVGDATSTLIRKVSPSGRCIDFVGASGSSGDVNSDVGSDCRLGGGGLGLTVDLSGNLFVADTANHKIKKIYSNGKTVNIAGKTTGFSGNVNGVGATARFSSPQDCCVSPNGTIFVADTANHRIRKVEANGSVVTLAGGASGNVDATGNTARFNSPRRICMAPDGKTMYVLDHGNSAIRKVDESGNVTTFCAYNPTASGTGDIAMDKSGFLYILENHS